MRTKKGKYKTNTKYKTNKKNKYKTRRRFRGGGYGKEDQENKDHFRETFMNSFDQLRTATKEKNPEKLNDATEHFKNFFETNETFINTLIPITTNSLPINKYQYSEGTTPLLAFVPPLVIIFNAVDDETVRKTFIDNFILYKGNINLVSYSKNISALSEAIKLQDKELVKYLVEKGSDSNILTEEQKTLMENLIKDSEIDAIIEENTPIPLVKLTFPTALPSSYDSDIEPEFWKPIFKENEMISIRNKILEMIENDKKIKIKPDDTVDG